MGKVLFHVGMSLDGFIAGPNRGPKQQRRAQLCPRKQYLNAGLIDEFEIALAPIVLGDGLRLFEDVDARKVSIEIVEAIHSPRVTHLRYSVTRR